MKQQTYKIKSRQTLLKAKAQRLRTFKLKIFTLVFLSIVSYYIFPHGAFENISSLPNKFLKQKAFTLDEVEILGVNKLSYNQVLKTAELDEVKNIFDIDLISLREKLKTNPWIEGASLSRIFPSKIKISIKERVPSAIWWHKGKFYLVDHSGFVIEKVSENSLKTGYLLIVGEDANKDYHAIQDMLFHNKLSNQVLSIIKIGNRRWDLYLQGDLQVKLPEVNVEKSLEILANIVKYKNNDLSVIDLRLIPDKIYIEYKSKDG
ncbi:hypothetical protein NF27_EY02260 [Candidatus Jidaibacter acanthamoeba]|uniref:POTRA domain-containing protein n=1 Tax=Candidatus Jidaibacter acanthamoebae TaxID=86105 RepID=A0A0C1QYR5_9RICK|nr:cell division protein FtsQ/DivIB [Candidatus Jidaibacter acanthamoeba]KIE05130.1 hypothetical protein NF27_EY02260 [Candidatus Jidaibacter acanthamoeba]